MPIQPRENQIKLQTLHAQFAENYALGDALIFLALDEDEHAKQETIQSQIQSLSVGLHLPYPEDLLDSVCRLNDHFVSKLGFTGNTEDYFHPHNSLVHKVIENRTGLPIVLSALYMEIAKNHGVDLVGIGFPRHFIIRPKKLTSNPFYIDPFHQGAIITEDTLQEIHNNWNISLPFAQCVQECSNHRMILRMSNNLYNAYNLLDDHTGRLRNINRLLLLQPHVTELYKTRACALGKLGYYEKAAEALQCYIHFHPEASDLQESIQILQMLYDVLQRKCSSSRV